MPCLRFLVIVCLVLFSTSSFAQNVENSSLPKVAANDNRTPAGRLTNGVLELRLTLNEGGWYPEEETAGHRDVYAFAEEGHAPQSSGPLTIQEIPLRLTRRKRRACWVHPSFLLAASWPKSK
jgi:hypothetical protein